MANDGDSLLREVDEELRRERMEKLWQRYNGLIIGVAVAIVAGVAGYQFLETRRITSAQAAGKEFNAAVELANQKKGEEAIKAFQHVAETGPRGYASLAKLHIAGAYVKEGKTAEAVTAFDALAADAGADQLLKNYAQLQAASLRMGEADFNEMENRLKSLTGASSPYKVSASELLGFAAYKAGKLEEARKLLEPLLIDPNATQAIQDRIKVVMAEIASAEQAKSASGTPTPAADKPATPAEAKPDAVPAEKSEAAPAATTTSGSQPEAPAAAEAPKPATAGETTAPAPVSGEAPKTGADAGSGDKSEGAKSAP